MLANPVYPGHYEVRRVNRAGNLYLHGRAYFLSEVLIDEQIGLTEVADGLWSIYFCEHHLARFNGRTGEIG